MDKEMSKLKDIANFLSKATGKSNEVILGYLVNEFNTFDILPKQTFLYKVTILYQKAIENKLPLKLLNNQLAAQFNISVNSIKNFRSAWGLT